MYEVDEKIILIIYYLIIGFIYLVQKSPPPPPPFIHREREKNFFINTIFELFMYSEKFFGIFKILFIAIVIAYFIVLKIYILKKKTGIFNNCHGSCQIKVLMYVYTFFLGCE